MPFKRIQTFNRTMEDMHALLPKEGVDTALPEYQALKAEIATVEQLRDAKSFEFSERLSEVAFEQQVEILFQDLKQEIQQANKHERTPSARNILELMHQFAKVIQLQTGQDSSMGADALVELLDNLRVRFSLIAGEMSEEALRVFAEIEYGISDFIQSGIDQYIHTTAFLIFVRGVVGTDGEQLDRYNTISREIKQQRPRHYSAQVCEAYAALNLTLTREAESSLLELPPKKPGPKRPVYSPGVGGVNAMFFEPRKKAKVDTVSADKVRSDDNRPLVSPTGLDFESDATPDPDTTSQHAAVELTESKQVALTSKN